MDQVLAQQLNRTKILLNALEVAKNSENYLAENLVKDIQICLRKSQQLLDKTKEVVMKKKEISEKMDNLANKCDLLAEKAERINESVFSNQSINSSTPLKSKHQLSSVEETSDGLEVSPCPSTWYNGLLDSPMPTPGLVGTNGNGGRHLHMPVVAKDVQIPCIRMLHPNEMNSVPAYMKGRLTCENVNYFINTVNSVLELKYSIALLKRKDVKRKDLVLYTEWKSQEQEFGMIGKAYFTTDDLLNLGHQKIDKMTDKMIQILRHTNRLRQTRANKKVVIYCLI